MSSGIKHEISSLNSVCSEVERLSLQEQRDENKIIFTYAIQKTHTVKDSFNDLVNAMIQRTGFGKASIVVSAPSTLRSSIAFPKYVFKIKRYKIKKLYFYKFQLRKEYR